MEIKEVNYNQEETPLFDAECEHCHHTWFPFENKDYSIKLPIEIALECPKCNKNTVHFYPDAEMNKDILRRKYVLGYDKKIENAKKKIETLTKERDEWKNRHDDKTKSNEKLIDILDRLVKKLEEVGVEVDDSDKKFQHFS